MVEMDLWTATQIADKLGEPPQRVCYIIRKYRLKPVHGSRPFLMVVAFVIGAIYRPVRFKGISLS